MLRQAIAFLLFFPQLVFAQTSDLPFQILVAQDAYVYGKAIEPLSFVDDVTSIEVNPGGFLTLVHKGGTTYELKEKVFTFYLKPEKLKDLSTRPDLAILYADSAIADQTENIIVLHPVFDENRELKWETNTPFEFYWHMPDEPVIPYKISVSDSKGKKIQDYRTSRHNFTLKLNDYGLKEDTFIFQISRTLTGKTISSDEYRLTLVQAPTYDIKTSDLVLKALNMELSPVTALEVWKEIIGMENGKYYFLLFEKFLNRNKEVLIKSGEDVEQLLSQNK